MEKNLGKNKKKNLISLGIILAVVLVFAEVTITTLISRNVKTNLNIDTSGQVQVEDEDTLRKVLQANATYSVTITKDIVVSKELTVNGTKTLHGKSIIMNMKHIGTAESVCAVTSGSKLILDGATIDGNGVVNGISVKNGGNLECLSGNVIYGYPYGLDVSGYADIKDVTIDESMHTGINVAILGEVHMKGGVISNNVFGVAVAEDGYMEIADSVNMTNAYASFIINYGETKVAGGRFEGAGDNAIENYNKLSIKGTDNDKIEICNGTKSAINSKNKAKIEAENIYIHDMGWHGLCVEKSSTADLKNITIENAGKSSIYINSSKVEMTDVAVLGGKAYAISANKNSKVEMENITVKDTNHRGIVNDGSMVQVENLVIEKTAKHGFYTIGEEAVTTITKATITEPGVSAVAVAGGKATITDVTIEDTTKEGVSVGKEGKAKIENVTIKRPGNFGVANYGGEADVRKSEITDSKNAGIIAKDSSSLTVKDVRIKNAGKQAIAIESNSVAGITNCKIDKTRNAAVYISKSIVTMKNSTIDNAGSYAIAVKDSKKSDGKKVHLDDIVIKNPKAQGIGNINSYVLPQNIKIYDSGQAGIYTEGKDSITNMNQIEVVNSNTSGLGFKGGDITARNVTVTSPKKQGIIALKDANIKQLDNVTITDSGSHGMEIDGGKCKITVDEKYNPENTKGNGVTIINPNNVGILCKNGGIVNAKGVMIKNAKSQAFSVEKESKFTVDGCTIEKTGKAGVYVFDSNFTMKNASMTDAATVGIAVKDCKKADEKKVQLDTVTIKNTGAQGISNNNSYVLPQNVKIYNTKQASIYSEGSDAITNMNQIEIVDSRTSGFGFKAGEVTARNVTIINPKNYGIDLLADANIKKLDNVTITNPGKHGINNQGGIVNITVDAKYNPDNVNENGITITNAGEYGINISKAGTVKVAGATITNSGDRGISSAGTLVVSGAGTEKNGVTISGTNGYGIYLTADASIKGSGLNIADTGKTGIFSEGANLDVSDFELENTSEQGAQFKGGIVTISDFNIGKTGSAAIKAMNGAEVTLTDGTIFAHSYAIATEGTASGENTEAFISKLTATDVKIERANKTFKNELVSVGADSEFTLNGAKSVIDGKYTKENAEFTGRGVRVYGTFTMNDGNILRNQGENGAGVRVEKGATFTMNDGTIKENAISGTSKGYGAGILVQGTFVMNDGTIANHGSKSAPIKVEGAGVCLSSTEAVFTMNGGEIRDNYSSEAGAAITMRDGNKDYPVFNMYGGSITNNKTTVNGGGIALVTGVFTMHEGATISQNEATQNGGGMTMSGGAANVKPSFIMNGGKVSSNVAKAGKDINFSGTATIKLAKLLTENMYLKSNSYADTRQIAAKHGDITDAQFADSMKYIIVDPSNGVEWFVADTGYLAKTGAIVQTADANTHYASLESAIDAAAEGSTIKICDDATITKRVTKSLTFINDKAVTLTAADSFADHMFVVAEDKALTITGKDANNKISIVASANTKRLVTNSGTTKLSNIQITGGTNGIWNETGTVTVNSVKIQDGACGMRIIAGTVNLDDVSINNMSERGIYCEGGTLNVSNNINPNNALTIDNVGTSGVYIKNATMNSDINNIGIGTYVINISNVAGKALDVRSGSSVNVSSIKVNTTTTSNGQGLYFEGASNSGVIATISNFEVSGTNKAAVRLMTYCDVTLTNGVVTVSNTEGIATGKNNTLDITNMKVYAPQDRITSKKVLYVNDGYVANDYFGEKVTVSVKGQ